MRNCRIIIAIILLISILVMPAYAYEELAKGSKGEVVVELQENLNAIGYPVGQADGDFGGKTESAIKLFQKEHRIAETGIADASTMELIEKEADIIDSLDSIYNTQDAMSFLIPKSGAKSVNMIIGSSVLPGGMEIISDFEDISSVLPINVNAESFPYGWVAFQKEGSMTICYRAKDMTGVAVCKSSFYSGGGIILASIIEGCSQNNIEECGTFVDIDSGEVHYWQPPNGHIQLGIVGYESLTSFCKMLSEVG